MRHTLILLMIAILLASMTGLTACGDDEYDEFEDGIYGDEEEKTGSQNSAGLSADNQSSAEEAAENSKGLFMQVDKATGKMLIRRPGQDTSAST